MKTLYIQKLGENKHLLRYAGSYYLAKEGGSFKINGERYTLVGKYVDSLKRSKSTN